MCGEKEAEVVAAEIRKTALHSQPISLGARLDRPWSAPVVIGPESVITAHFRKNGKQKQAFEPLRQEQVQPRIHRVSARNKKQGAAAGFEQAGNRFERLFCVGNMLQKRLANHQIAVRLSAVSSNVHANDRIIGSSRSGGQFRAINIDARYPYSDLPLPFDGYVVIFSPAHIINKRA